VRSSGSVENRGGVSPLRDRLRPFHAVMAAVLCLGVAASLWRRAGDPATLGYLTVLVALTEGLLALLLFRFTVGNVWAYVVEYLNAGGSVTDPPVALPFVAAGVVGVGTGLAAGVGAAAWAAFWAFVVAAGLVTVGVWVRVGYREAGG
jgi:nicotinamide riboside transporter PnuC